MADTRLRNIETKVTEIHTLLVGADGVPESGLIGRVRDMDKRLAKNETWTTRILTAAGLGAVGGGGTLATYFTDLGKVFGVGGGQ